MNAADSTLTYILDASALLAMLHEEDGGEAVSQVVSASVISSLNWSEVLQKSLARNIDIEIVKRTFEGLGLQVVPFTAEDAEQAAQLWPVTREHGLSLVDRACLGLAQKLNLPVLTADRVWANLGLDVDVQVIR